MNPFAAQPSAFDEGQIATLRALSSDSLTHRMAWEVLGLASFDAAAPRLRVRPWGSGLRDRRTQDALERRGLIAFNVRGHPELTPKGRDLVRRALSSEGVAQAAQAAQKGSARAAAQQALDTSRAEVLRLHSDVQAAQVFGVSKQRAHQIRVRLQIPPVKTPNAFDRIAASGLVPGLDAEEAICARAHVSPASVTKFRCQEGAIFTQPSPVRHKVLTTLREREATIAELALVAGWRKKVFSSYFFHRYVDQGLVREAGRVRPPGRGRPSKLWALTPEGLAWLEDYAVLLRRPASQGLSES